MRKRLFCERGQIASILIAIIVILLIAIMVTVNIGKLSLLKTSVSNAADAGALAGASAMATGLSHGTGNIGFYSDSMLADWASTQAAFILCPSCTIAWVVYGAHVASQAAQYALAAVRAGDALDEAKNSAKQMAFSNAGIDEAKSRKCKKESLDGKCEEWGETYEEWLQSKSTFEQWMENKTYNDGKRETTYSWEESLKYGQTSATQADKTNSVTVSVDTPSWTVIPLPGIIWFRGTIHEFGCKVCCCFCYCGPLPTTWGLASVSGAEDPIRVEVTRMKPGTNLGLWKTSYKTTSGGNITSSAEAKAYGGSVLPAGSDYDSKLSKTE